MRRYLPGGWRSKTLPVHVFVVRHPEGTCVFDTGQCVQATSPGYFPRWYPFFRLARFELAEDDEAAAQLSRMGVEQKDLRWTVVSHLHTDHAGGLAGVSGAEVLVSRVEWERAVGLRGRLRGYLPQYWPVAVSPRLIDFDGSPVGPFAGSFALTSDEALLLVPTPGHTPGHMSLLVDRTYLLAGDLCESADRIEDVNPLLARYCRDEGIVVLTTHDPEAPNLLAERLGRDGRQRAR